MQNVYTPPFEDRMTYYIAKMVAEQGKVGWNYDLDPVILIGITDFDFPHLTKQAIQEFEFRERITGESLTKKLRMLFYSLKQIPKDWELCENELQKCLYLVKNMDKMDKNSKPYKEGGYEDLFESAESVHVLGEDAVLYSQSLAHLRAVQAGLDFRYEEGIEEGIREGITLGEEQGRLSEREVMARRMKAAGTDVDFIALITEMSPDRIKEL